MDQEWFYDSKPSSICHSQTVILDMKRSNIQSPYEPSPVLQSKRGLSGWLGWEPCLVLRFKMSPVTAHKLKSLPCVSLNVCVVFSKRFARRNPVFAQWDTTLLLTGGPEKQRGRDRRGREPKGTDGWKRLKERIVRAEQTGRKRWQQQRRKTEGREKRETELTEKRGTVAVAMVGVQRRGGKIRVKACLLWQSPRPSVLPCSTSCSKADLRGNRDIMVSSGKQGRPRRLATPNKVAEL